MWRALTTACQRALSALMKAANSGAELPTGSPITVREVLEGGIVEVVARTSDAASACRSWSRSIRFF